MDRMPLSLRLPRLRLCKAKGGSRQDLTMDGDAVIKALVSNGK